MVIFESLSLEQLENLENEFKTGKKTFEEASKKILNSLIDLSQIDSWEEKKKRLIKDNCERCGSTQKPLFLHQRFQPNSIYHYQRIFFKDYYKKEEDNPVLTVSEKDINNYMIEKSYTIEGCPQCESKNVFFRRNKVLQYKCGSCRNEFANPIEIKMYPSIETAKRHMSVRKAKEYIMNKYGEDINKQALLRFIDDHKRYLSLKDVVTYCHLCAFSTDNKQGTIRYSWF